MLLLLLLFIKLNLMNFVYLTVMCMVLTVFKTVFLSCLEYIFRKYLEIAILSRLPSPVLRSAYVCVFSLTVFIFITYTPKRLCFHFVCLFICLLAGLRKKYSTGFHKIR